MTLTSDGKIDEVEPKIDFKKCAYCQEDKHKRGLMYCSERCKILFNENIPYFWQQWIFDLWGAITTGGELSREVKPKNIPVRRS